MTIEAAHKPKRAVVAAVQLPSVTELEFDASLTELRQLAKTLGFQVVHRFTQKRAGLDSAGYFGLGKRQELRGIVMDRTMVILVPETTVDGKALIGQQRILPRSV